MSKPKDEKVCCTLENPSKRAYTVRPFISVDRIIRHVKHRIQQCEWAINRGEPYHDQDSRKEELETLLEWIERRC